MRKTLKKTLSGIAIGATLLGLSSCGESSVQQEVYDKQGNSIGYAQTGKISHFTPLLSPRIIIQGIDFSD